MKVCYLPKDMAGMFPVFTIIPFFTLALFFFLPAQLAALDYYWVNGAGNWSDHNNHWATTSGGGVFHDQVPTSMDNVYFDANSGFSPGNNTVTIDQTVIYCMDMDWTGVTGVPVFSGPADKQLYVYGSMTLIADMQWNLLGDTRFRAFQPGKTITTAGQIFKTVILDGVGGEWMLLDEFTTSASFRHSSGTFRTNNQTLNAGKFNSECSNAQRGIYFGSSTINISTSFDICNNGSNLTFDAGTSTIHMLSSGYGNFVGCNLSFYDVVFHCPTGNIGCSGQYFHSVQFQKDGLIGGSNTYETLIFTPGYLYSPEPNTNHYSRRPIGCLRNGLFAVRHHSRPKFRATGLNNQSKWNCNIGLCDIAGYRCEWRGRFQCK